MVVLVGGLWAAFAVELGDKTFAEHIDTISETPEAKQLVEDTRATINPALAEVRDRVLGEYVEAPTWIPEAEIDEAAESREREPIAVTGGGKAHAEGDAEPPLPGRRRTRPPAAEPEQDFEPALPGRR